MSVTHGFHELPQSRLSRWRWPIVFLLALSVLLYETLEHKPAAFPEEWEEYLREIFLYALVLPAFMGIVLELLTRYYRERYHHIAYLNLDRILRSQIAAARKPDEIENIVLELPLEVLTLAGSSLHILETPIFPHRHTAHRGFNGKPPPSSIPDMGRETCRHNPAGPDPQLSILEPCACVENHRNPDQPFCLPLEYGGLILAILVLYPQPGHHPTGEQVKLLTEIAPSLAQAVDRAILFRAVSRQTLATREERHRIARDLHDSLAQNLAFLRLNLEHLVAKSASETTKPLLQDELEQMSQVAAESYEYLRGAIDQLDPVVQPDLETVLRNHAQMIGKRAGFSVVMEVSGEARRLSPGIQRQILFIFREIIANIEKHAEAGEVRVRLHWDKERLAVTVRDDGKGFDPGSEQGKGKFGLNILNERSIEIGADLELHSEPDKGTEVILTLPLPLEPEPILSMLW
jgi:signal transduction histidine kinase